MSFILLRAQDDLIRGHRMSILSRVLGAWLSIHTICIVHQDHGLVGLVLWS